MRSYVLGICLMLGLALSSQPLAATSDSHRLDSVWVAEQDGALRVASAGGEVLLELTDVGRVRAVDIDLRQGTLWLLGETALTAYSSTGETLFSIPIAAASSPHAELEIDLATGNTWLAVDAVLAAFDPAGQLVAEVPLPATVAALTSYGEGGSIWVATANSVLRIDAATGLLLGELELDSEDRVRDVAFDLTSQHLLLALDGGVRFYSTEGVLLADVPIAGARRVTGDGEGGAWVATNKDVSHVGPAGGTGSLSPFGGVATIEQLAATGGGKLWLATQHKLALIDPAIGEIAVYGLHPPSRIWDIAVNPDGARPLLSIETPQNGQCLPNPRLELIATCTDLGWGCDSSTVEITVDGSPVEVDCGGDETTFSCSLSEALADGTYDLTASINDFGGLSADPVSLTVTVDTVSPTVVITSPPEGVVTTEPEISIHGSVSEAATVSLAGEPLTLGEDLGFTSSPLALDFGENRFEVRAVDCAGNLGTASRIVTREEDTRDDLPPDPSEVAPSLDQTVATDFAAAIEFLYSGAQPIQRDLDPSAIDLRRVAVVRGRVTTRDGEPLAGVTVRPKPAHDQALGYTLTRADGMYDLVVNGGGAVVLDIAKDGYVPAHRRIDAPWRDWVWAPETALVPYDTETTVISLGNDEAAVARGSLSVDEDGSRRATLIVPAGTQATLSLPGNQQQPLSSLTIRATEFTVGPGGLEAMPAVLPATSAYTYAVELSADEAIAAGALGVRFDRPIYHYVENFLGFPVGEPVPAGYYDRELATWVASDDGRVIEILSVAGGSALIDVMGGGHPASEAELDELGFTTGELERIAEIYEPGQTLWRTPIPHFTPWDCNWPYGPPEDAEAPPDQSEPVAEGDEGDNEPTPFLSDPDCQAGSIIECQNQVLGERYDLTAAPHDLVYRSDRSAGFVVDDSFRLDLVGPAVPQGLKRVEVVIDMAGMRHRYSFTPSPNLRYTFIWDGKDVYGRPVQGRRTAKAHLGYVYDAVYQPVRRDVDRTFGALGAGVSVTAVRARREITLWRTSKHEVGGFDASAIGLGGWSLDSHHVYDPEGRRLYLGDGRQRAAHGSEGSVFNVRFLSASSTRVVEDVEVAEDGAVFYLDFSLGQLDLWRIDPVNGTRRLVHVFNDGASAIAVRGEYLYWTWTTRNTSTGKRSGGVKRRRWTSSFGPHEVVLSVGPLSVPTDLAFGPDGILYVLDSAGPRLLAVPAREEFITIAEGLFDDYGTPSSPGSRSFTIREDGTFFITGLHRIFELRLDGAVSVIAGTGIAGFDGEGVPGRLNTPRRLAIAGDGSLLVADRGNNRIRRVTEGGRLTTVLGTGSGSYNSEVLARGVGVPRPTALAFSPDGDLYYTTSRASGGLNRLYRLSYPFPGSGGTSFRVADEEGGAVYEFDESGRHLRTLHSLTGAQLLDFGYDAGGQLSSVADTFGNTTSFERDADGRLEAIVGPFGHRTRAQLDAAGYLEWIENPEGDRTNHRYHANGLLSELHTPRGFPYRFAYSSLGRLLSDEDPAGGAKSLARSGHAQEYSVSVTTGLGIRTSYEVAEQTGGGARRRTIRPDGTAVETVLQPAGHRDRLLADGTTTTQSLGFDQRFGIEAPFLRSLSVDTPQGRSMRISRNRSFQTTPGIDHLNVASLREDVTVNGRTTSSLFDGTAHTLTVTSPEGRTTSATVDQFMRPQMLNVPGLAPVHLSYDLRGRIDEIRQEATGDARFLKLRYGSDGLLETLTDAEGRTTRLSRDAAGRVTSRLLPGGRDVALSWDAAGNIESVAPPARPPHHFGYTPVDLPARYQPPVAAGALAPVTLYGYDVDRNLRRIERADNQSLTFDYDHGRLKSISTPEGIRSFHYGTISGRLEQVVNPSGDLVSYSWDGPLPLATTWAGRVGGSVAHAFDNNFWVRSQEVNGGHGITFTYDDDGLLTGAGASIIHRDPANGLLIGNDIGVVATSLTYNPFGEPNSFITTVTGEGIFRQSFIRDRLGRITRKIEALAETTTIYDYAYDPAGRLERVYKDGDLLATYGYDGNGNRTSYDGPFGTFAGTHDDQDRLLVYGNTTHTYTDDGELSRKEQNGMAVLYDYDVLGNLRRVDLPDGIVLDYLVDGQNRRVGKKINGVLARGWLYQDQLNPVAELDGAGNVVSRFVYASRPNVPDYMARGGVTYVIVSDHLGSPRLVIDAGSGEIVQRLDYDEFGRVILDTNPGFQPFGFAGGLYDSQTGLVRFGARDYDSIVGRWTAKDPIGFSGRQANLYTYAGQDPVTYRDPTGLSVVACGVGADGSVGPFAGEADAFVWIDSALNYGTGYSYGAGGGLASPGGSAYIALSLVPTGLDMAGTGGEVAASGAVFGGSIAQSSAGIAFEFSASPGGDGIGVLGVATNTTIQQRGNLKDDLREGAESLWNSMTNFFEDLIDPGNYAPWSIPEDCECTR